MLTPTPKKQTVDDTRLGDYAAMQPLSGVQQVNEAFASNGFGCGNYVHIAESSKEKSKR